MGVTQGNNVFNGKDEVDFATIRDDENWHILDDGLLRYLEALGNILTLPDQNGDDIPLSSMRMYVGLPRRLTHSDIIARRLTGLAAGARDVRMEPEAVEWE
jgi:hypothetical protein